MVKTVEVPLSLLRKMARAAESFAQLEDELENYLLAMDPEFISSIREARADHMAGKVRPLSDLKQELCIE